MAPSDARDAPIDVLGEDDLEGALALSEEAGWNQVDADWLLMLRLGSGFAVRDGGRVVATALALPYPPAFGWVSMVLVHTPYRRLGLATRLLERATAALTRAGLLPVLDATPAGAEVYGRVGFRPVGNLLRWRGIGGAGVGASPEELAIDDRVRDLDDAAFGADRGAILADLSARPAPVAALAAGGDGYLLMPGSSHARA
jgi:GNAT superfamily N-acetyltransferase